MKFGLFLLENMVSEWHSFYINYHKLKKFLKTFKKNFRKAASPKNARDSFGFQKSPGKESFITIKEKPSEKENTKPQISFTQLKIKFYRQVVIELYKVDYFFKKNLMFYENKLKPFLDNYIYCVNTAKQKLTEVKFCELFGDLVENIQKAEVEE